MRRIALLLLTLALAPAANAAAPDKIAEVAIRDAEATCRYGGGPCQEPASEAAVAAFESSWEHRTLVFQHRLGDDVGMADAPWAATHNSFNSITEMGPALSTTDSNQQIGLVEQLRLGIRSLELDVHNFLGSNVVCHARGANEGHAGCSVEKGLAATLEPIKAWVDANPGQVLMLYLEDHMGDQAGYDAAAETVNATFGSKLYAPKPAGTGCQVLPTTLTRDDVLAAGARVFVVSDCGPGGGWGKVAFDWGPMHDEGQPDDFDAKTCGPFKAERLSRYYEDSTGLSYAVSGGGTDDARMTTDVVKAMVRCGIDHIGFDQLLPGDGRLEAMVWSWAKDQPAPSGSCAIQRADGRWSATSCKTRARPACRAGDGSWTVPRKQVRARDAAKACSREDASLAAPRKGDENAALRAAAGSDPVVLGLRRAGSGGFVATDPR